MHMKGLPAWQYPLALPACAIERNLFPPRRISIFAGEIERSGREEPSGGPREGGSGNLCCKVELLSLYFLY